MTIESERISHPQRSEVVQHNFPDLDELNPESVTPEPEFPQDFKEVPFEIPEEQHASRTQTALTKLNTARDKIGAGTELAKAYGVDLSKGMSLAVIATTMAEQNIHADQRGWDPEEIAKAYALLHAALLTTGAENYATSIQALTTGANGEAAKGILEKLIGENNNNDKVKKVINERMAAQDAQNLSLLLDQADAERRLEEKLLLTTAELATFMRDPRRQSVLINELNKQRDMNTKNVPLLAQPEYSSNADEQAMQLTEESIAEIVRLSVYSLDDLRGLNAAIDTVEQIVKEETNRKIRAAKANLYAQKFDSRADAAGKYVFGTVKGIIRFFLSGTGELFSLIKEGGEWVFTKALQPAGRYIGGLLPWGTKKSPIHNGHEQHNNPPQRPFRTINPRRENGKGNLYPPEA